MANKTIYFRDDALWAKAKTLAGTEGLSAVVQKAMEQFVQEAERQREGVRRFTFRLLIRDEDDPDAFIPTERIAFDGTVLAEFGGVSMSVDPDGAPSQDIACHLTRAGAFVFTLSDSTSGGEANDITYYRVYDAFSDLKEDPELKRISAPWRGHFLAEISRQLGQDWEIWID